MKTELALLLTHDKPTMTAAQVAELFGVTERTLENQIYAERCPIPMFKIGSKFAAHISDVAGYIDNQRAEAKAAMELNGIGSNLAIAARKAA
jgi:predicted transcriptional regulator